MPKFTRSTPVNEVQQMTVIMVRSIIGNGTHESPICEVTEYYSLDGELLARRTSNEELSLGKWEMKYE